MNSGPDPHKTTDTLNWLFPGASQQPSLLLSTLLNHQCQIWEVAHPRCGGQGRVALRENHQGKSGFQEAATIWAPLSLVTTVDGRPWIGAFNRVGIKCANTGKNMINDLLMLRY